MPRISGAQNIRRRVEDRIVGRIGHDNRLDDDRFHEMSGVCQITCKARRFPGRDPVTRLNPRIEQYTFDLVENEPGQNQHIIAQDDIEEAQSRSTWTGNGPDQDIRIESESHPRWPRTPSKASLSGLPVPDR